MSNARIKLLHRIAMHSGVWMLLFLFSNCLKVEAQKQNAICGQVMDQQSGELLMGATIRLMESKSVFTQTNAYGFFSISARSGLSHLVISFPSYYADTLIVSFDGNEKLLSVKLKPILHELKDVVVVNSSASGANVSPDGIHLKMSAIKEMPSLLGESDVLKVIQLMPGIQSESDGGTGFYVRGGNIDENLIMLDEMPIYNPSHLLGFFSTFNSDAVRDISLYKNAIPASYGGRLSSVVDIHSNDGNNARQIVSGGIGLIASRLNLEGPLGRSGSTSSYMLNGRRTYLDYFLKLSSDSSQRESSIYFYDLNGKLCLSSDPRNRVTLSAYLGRDHLGLGNLFDLKYGNRSAVLKWTHLFSKTFFSNTSLVYSKYDYLFHRVSSSNDFSLSSDIRQFELKSDFQFYTGNLGQVDFGYFVNSYNLQPGMLQTNSNSSYNATTLEKRHALENGVYLSHDWHFSTQWHLVYGLRASVFSPMGPGHYYIYDASGDVTDSVVYHSDKILKNYLSLEPRIALSFVLDPQSQFRAAYDRTTQNIHLISNETSSDPMDVWLLSSNNTVPETSDQLSVGYFRNFSTVYSASAELYYRFLGHQIDCKDGADILLDPTLESELLSGKGKAYGLELYVQKKTGRLSGWISYTLARTFRKIAGINNGNWYPANQDRIHNLSVVSSYKLSWKWTLSAVWVYYSGNAVTWPVGKYVVNGVAVLYYGTRNSSRMPAYHRLDLGATLQCRKTKHYESSLSFSLYNAYGHENAYTINFKQDPLDASKIDAVQFSLFRFIPSVTFNFKF